MQQQQHYAYYNVQHAPTTHTRSWIIHQTYCHRKQIIAFLMKLPTEKCTEKESWLALANRRRSECLKLQRIMHHHKHNSYIDGRILGGCVAVSLKYRIEINTHSRSLRLSPSRALICLPLLLHSVFFFIDSQAIRTPWHCVHSEQIIIFYSFDLVCCLLAYDRPNARNAKRKAQSLFILADDCECKWFVLPSHSYAVSVSLHVCVSSVLNSGQYTV